MDVRGFSCPACGRDYCEVVAPGSVAPPCQACGAWPVKVEPRQVSRLSRETLPDGG